MTKKKENEQYHSEPVQEILGIIPSWITRWGITLTFSILMFLLLGCCLINYPETISGTITLTSVNPPTSLVARKSGLLDTLLVRNGSVVHKGDILAVLSSTANTDDIATIRELINDNRTLSLENVSSLDLFNKEMLLGPIQQSWTNLKSSIREYMEYIEMGHARKRIGYFRKRQMESMAQYNQMEAQLVILKEDTRLQALSLQRDSILYASGALTLAEYERSSQSYLSKLGTLEAFKSTMEGARMNLTSFDSAISELEMTDAEQRRMLIRKFDLAVDALRSAYTCWSEDFAFVAPNDGIVSMLDYWARGQYVSIDEPLAYIVPLNRNEYKGKALISSAGIGKVEVGQSVNVRFSSFDYTEFGIVRGIVDDISTMPERKQDGSIVYPLSISFPDGLITTYGRDLPFIQDMDGWVDIITLDRRLIGRIMYPIISLFCN